jgi:RimJ/RimL family protein N-acetyltransferase
LNSGIDLQPTLEGKRVTVRPIVTSDWDGLFAAAADAKIWELHPAPDRYLEAVFREYFDGALGCQSAFTFVDRESGKPIGSSRYHGYDPVRREVEIGWTFLSREYWGGSYNAEIKQLMLGHAFTFADTALFWVGDTNLRSRRAMEKIGGILRDGIQFRDFSGDMPYVVYEISAPTPPAGQPDTR